MQRWLSEHVGIVRIRQLVDDLTHRIAFVPTVLMIVAVAASQVSLWIDRRFADSDPFVLPSTTSAGARAVFAAIAGGLITAVTLLLSIMLVAVQLASRQFSPRTLRNWLGDRTLRWAVGIVLATTVFCLMALRGLRGTDGEPTVPALTVHVAIFLGVVSLIAMIRAVDHVTRSLQVGTVAQQLADDTIAIIERSDRPRSGERPATTPAAPGAAGSGRLPETAVVVEAATSGWVQQIDDDGILHALPDDAVAWTAVAHGSYVTTDSPLAYLDVEHGDEVVAAIRSSFALGPTRTMQQDVGFGLQQLTDIAVRALSPGVNDPQTANDIVVHIGEVLGAIWSRPSPEPVVCHGSRSLHRHAPDHGEHLIAALDPIRRHGCTDPAVMATMTAMLTGLRSEVVRRGLPGPVDPIDRYLSDIDEVAGGRDWLGREREALAEAGRPMHLTAGGQMSSWDPSN